MSSHRVFVMSTSPLIGWSQKLHILKYPNHVPNIYILIYKPPIYFELIQLQRTVSYAIQKAKADLIPNGPDTSDWGKVNQTLTCSIFYFFSKNWWWGQKRCWEDFGWVSNCRLTFCHILGQWLPFPVVCHHVAQICSCLLPPSPPFLHNCSLIFKMVPNKRS